MDQTDADAVLEFVMLVCGLGAVYIGGTGADILTAGLGIAVIGMTLLSRKHRRDAYELRGGRTTTDE